MSVLLGVISLFAVVSLIAASVQAAAMVRLAPAGERLASFMPLGWWKFRQIESKAGPKASAHASIYKRAVLAFLVFLVLGLILSGWTAGQRQAPATATLDVPAASQFAFNTEISRVATMPGAPILES